MSQTTEPDAPEPTDENRGLDWLKRNAEQIDPKAHVAGEIWDKAKLTRSKADVDDLSAEDVYRVERPNGDPHLCLFVTHTNDAHAGACSCDGFNFNGYCRHLLALAQLDVTDDILRTDDDRAEELLEGDVDQPDPDIQEYDDQDDGLLDHLTRVQQMDSDEDLFRCQTCGSEMQEPAPEEHKVGCPHGGKPDDWPGEQDDHGDDPTPQEPEVVESTTKNVPDTQGSTGENQPADPSTKAFAGELPDVGKEYVMEMGGETYIRRAGYARLARAEGFRLKFEEIVGAHETDWTRSKYWVRVVNEDGEHIAEDVGTAGPPDAEDMSDAESNLDELAATRAATRALAWATGEGLNAVEEVAEEHAERVR